jgi:hypothetical protein
MTHNPTANPPADNGGGFGPRQAAALLTQTTQRTRRQIEPAQPWLLVIRGIGVLVVCMAAWLSVRNQHPYKGPTAAVVPVLVAFGVLNFLVTVSVRKRATHGVAGRSRLHRTEIAILAAAWIVPFVLMVVLAPSGVSSAVLYGVYPATVPLLVAGLAWAAMCAVRAQWRECATGLAVAAVGTVDAFIRPAGVWLSTGIGLCVVLLASAAVIVWQQHRSAVWP